MNYLQLNRSLRVYFWRNLKAILCAFENTKEKPADSLLWIPRQRRGSLILVSEMMNNRITLILTWWLQESLMVVFQGNMNKTSSLGV